MVTEFEITKGKVVPKDLSKNLSDLLSKVNKLRKLIGLPFIITSGYRSKEEQIKIYRDKGITDLSKIPMSSAHIFCMAIDILDKDGKLAQLVCTNDYKLLKECDLYIESRKFTKGWLHLQIREPASKQREFIP